MRKRKRGGLFSSKRQPEHAVGVDATHSDPYERATAKALFFDSGGTMKIKAIAAAVGVGERHVRKWRDEEQWPVELTEYKRTVEEESLKKLMTSPQMRELRKAAEIDGIAARNVIQDVVRRAVTTQVSDFLASFHAKDLQDLNNLNLAIRTHLIEGRL
jgi:uncharacterized protein YbaA (DUF1428 family)